MAQFVYAAEPVAEAAWGFLPVFVLGVAPGILVRASRPDGAARGAFACRVGLSALLGTVNRYDRERAPAAHHRPRWPSCPTKYGI